MYRTAAKRLLSGTTVVKSSDARFRLRNLQTIVTSTGICTSANPQSISNQNPNNQNQIPRTKPNQSDSNASSSPTSSSSSGPTSFTADEARRRHHHHHDERRIPRVKYQDEQARVLHASLRHVFFMDECLQKLIDRIDSGEELQNLAPSERISKLVRIRLEMQAPYISKWPQALSIQAHPSNIPTSFKQRAILLDEIWHTAGDEGSDINWYVKRTVVGGIYPTTEIYMLTDSSTDFRDTWSFLDDRVKDAFYFKKTIQEAQYLAEAVGAGMGNSLQGFVKRVFQG
ncbi:uncharacterized protein LOC110632578 isoform X2 [Hevea brasiliensis]|uniref:uncharacterized protein LOC110632578 isoform X2 n=1 Tax=Hevea brasiliensis TaxID=3981 RepID=UPI0025EB42FB|nr:uncharacterized protein LOC110632578 isoform X2 [Hevea brasiliensis]